MSDAIQNSELISVIIPTLNEEDYIAKAIDELSLSDDDYEILVVDGLSTDRTKEIVLEIALANPKVRYIENPRRIQAAAINIGAREAHPLAKAFVQADAHCGYPKDFSRKIVLAMRENNATSAVVPMLTVGEETPFQAAVALAQNSKLGNGGSAHRASGTQSGCVDHGHHAAFDKAFFLEHGGYDENFPINHDGEYDVRTAKAGAKVWMAADCSIRYFPRKTLKALAKQYFRYGLGRANTIFKHKARPKLRQLAPVVITTGVVGGAVLGHWDGRFNLLPLGYGVLIAAYSWKLVRASDPPSDTATTTLKVSRVTLAFATMHLAWGAGFLTKATSVFAQWVKAQINASRKS
ncbi:glycosyltransferase family 2 protein [Rhizobium sp. MHM7A]|uniref:glycosyltransferase family 2 protein n=1 Tax=Rhizobium sp. MHM7A TaxID=2583233 RepID=UPI00110649C1|nr:glycosyltransferase family 2 protein [Rhizobium sp. MHM7A]TLX16808.1 glycosyltransferase family 2 protein [Rhizobium sp. MHM7A]